jgi:hypothetical protein
MDRSLKAALGSFDVGFILITVKYAAHMPSGRIVFYSEGLNNVVNVAGAVTAVIDIRFVSFIRPRNAHDPTSG